jgi:hypothetical protein
MPQDTNYSSTTPAADANYQLAKWKADAPSADPAIVRNIAVEVPKMVASGASHQGGLVPDPGATAGTSKFLREDASFAVPPTFGASGGSHAPGYVPDPGATAGTSKFLREDGTWQTPAGGGAGYVGPTVTQLTFSTAAATLFTGSSTPQSALLADQTLTTPRHVKIRAWWKRTATTGGLSLFLVHNTGTSRAGYYIAFQNDGNFVCYRNVQSGSQVVVGTASGAATQDIAGWNYAEFEISIFDSSHNQIWGQLNQTKFTPLGNNSTDGTFDMTGSSGTIEIWVQCDGPNSTANIGQIFVESF